MITFRERGSDPKLIKIPFFNPSIHFRVSPKLVGKLLYHEIIRAKFVGKKDKIKCGDKYLYTFTCPIQAKVYKNL